jgi:hypothetical protein
MGALVAISILLFGKRGFGCHEDLLAREWSNGVLE